MISIRITSLYVCQPSPVVFACKTASFGSELQVSMGPSPPLWFLHSKQRLSDQNYKSLWVPALLCGFCIQNSAFRIRITSLSESQTSPIAFFFQNSDFSPPLWFLHSKQRLSDQNYKWVPALLCGFCIQNSAFRIRITSLSESQTSPIAFFFQNSILAPELQISMGPIPHLRFFSFKTATLAPELQVSMGPSPPLWFLHSKLRLSDQNYKSL